MPRRLVPFGEPCARLLIALLLAQLACSAATQPGEWGAECSDGKDNDGDGVIDCADSDCRSTPICGGSFDGPRPDRARPDLVPGADRPRPDRALPDQSSSTSFGIICSAPQTLCADGKTICVPGIGSPAGTGYCTYPCQSGDPYSCPAAPAGYAAACVFQYNYKFYCAFLCRFTGQDYPCPTGMSCFEANPPQPSQKYCWPR